jgi:hypothetical protein
MPETAMHEDDPAASSVDDVRLTFESESLRPKPDTSTMQLSPDEEFWHRRVLFHA